MNTLIFLFLQIQLTQVWCATCSGDKPNFLIVITDDQGHDDVGFYNTNGILQTPNIDKFASQSVQFENFYTDSLCAPTRASFLTGRHHLKTGVWGVHGATDYISLDETLISQVLKSNGYSTGMFGKWHNGVTSGYNPWNRGFDVAYVAKLYVFINNPMIRNGVNIETEGWVEDWLADRIIDYLQQRSKDGKPFALVWTPMSIHKGRLYDNEKSTWKLQRREVEMKCQYTQRTMIIKAKICLGSFIMLLFQPYHSSETKSIRCKCLLGLQTFNNYYYYQILYLLHVFTLNSSFCLLIIFRTPRKFVQHFILQISIFFYIDFLQTQTFLFFSCLPSYIKIVFQLLTIVNIRIQLTILQNYQIENN
eukprot:TRINITY_DN546_c0_g1_i4.p1 TRINITY_DN546_c0_g1~~TRINITY_DN546_c0_g1_i4.p1  ORF type:complete len:363 (+),score=-5.06 TRINITY_DN546_c0_g1_i4:172-1260(+)